MININAQFSGGQIASALQSDDEEMAYFLDGISDNIDASHAEAIFVHLPYGEGPKIATALRLLADHFDPIT